ncbi:MAG: helix-turn-helix domain-containing protein [Deltaproteobacteria bacterium]|nr:helix-turn-helix domain-containing protein [Deltaproteobacteria bacterium]
MPNSIPSTQPVNLSGLAQKKPLRKITTHETRAFAPDHLLTSHEVGTLLQMNPTSINNWARAGKLPAFRTPGGHRRIRCEDLAVFLEVHQMAIPSSLAPLTFRRLVWAEPDAYLQSVLKEAAAKSRIKLHLVDSLLQALAMVGHLQPHVLGVSLAALSKEAVSPAKLRKCLHADAQAKGIEVLTYGFDRNAPHNDKRELPPTQHRDFLPREDSLVQWMQGQGH